MLTTSIIKIGAPIFLGLVECFELERAERALRGGEIRPLGDLSGPTVA